MPNTLITVTEWVLEHATDEELDLLKRSIEGKQRARDEDLRERARLRGFKVTPTRKKGRRKKGSANNNDTHERKSEAG